MAMGVYERKPRNPYNRVTLVYGVGKVTPGKHPRANNYPAYVAWFNMIRRCYRGDMPSYARQSVCEDWTNYQNFADWYMQQPGHTLGWEVDKDLLANSAIYSPSTCTLLPGRINKALIIPTRTDLPTGITKLGTKYRVRVRTEESIGKHIGMFSTIEEAYSAYKVAKQNILTNLASIYKEHLAHKAYIKLTNYFSN